jgi:nonsense-mediated mRNA decay protein 3
MLCLRCGKRDQFANHLCEECILETVKPVSIPPVVQGNVCRLCGRLQKGRSWTEPFDGPADAAVHLAEMNVESSENVKTKRVELSVDHEDNNKFQISGRAESIYSGVIIKQDIACEVRLRPQTCSWCSRMQGNYYEAIIQLRGLDGLSDEELEELLGKASRETDAAHLKDPSVFMTKLEKVRGGYDLYMGENSFARQLAQKIHDEYGGEAKTTSSLFGRKDGRDIYRHTYLVRLPGFVKGDYLKGKEGPFKVLKIKRKVQVLDLRTGRETHIELQDAMNMRMFKPGDVEVDLVVIMDTGDEVQVLHPTTMRPVDLVKNIQVQISDTVTGVRIDDDIYLTV